jgi:ABC-type uncharacterized transport system permease subunit
LSGSDQQKKEEKAMAEALLIAVLLTSVPLILAATGELVAEKSGVLNLGVEGMMLMGAVAGFGVASLTGSAYLGIIGGGLAGMLISMVFAIFVLGLATNQVATGLALTIFGTGLSGLIGAPLVGQAIDGLPQLIIPWVSDLYIIGVFFQLDIMAYLSVLLVGLTAYVLNYTQFGLVLRSVGINHDSAHALGYPVLRVRFIAVLFGGFYGRIRWSLFAACANPSLVGRHDIGARMDRAGIGGFCLMAAVACGGWRGSFWRCHHYAIGGAGAWLGNPITVLVNATILCHNISSCSDFERWACPVWCTCTFRQKLSDDQIISAIY